MEDFLFGKRLFTVDEKFMRRALQLAANGRGRVSPNPMVGAVIVHDGRIIGEGFHAYYGGPHAEVNAIRSVRPEDVPLLKDATIYVTLEPCAHQGKTPPCANLIVDTGIPRVIIGSADPNPLVSGKGVKILEKAGISVEKGVLENECNLLNKTFMSAHTSKLPRIILKWAQSADGFMAALDDDGKTCGVKFSTPLSSVWMHRERSQVDAILVGANTEKFDHPLLNVRLWGGNSPKKYVASERIVPSVFSERLREEGMTSLMVEGGPTLLKSFIEKGLYDEIRVETSPKILGKGLKAPNLPPDLYLTESVKCRDNVIATYHKIQKISDVKKP